jgi:hypothetical protein
MMRGKIADLSALHVHAVTETLLVAMKVNANISVMPR